MKSKQIILSIILSLALSSCAQTSYLFEQGIGQLKLLSRAVENEKILKDPHISEEHKLKIRQVERAKDYFYNFWNKKKDPIYSKTTYLDQEAVTYLVIASQKNEIKAHETCFPFMGCFPYLGFFSEKSAKEYAHKKQLNQLSTYVRPVYAYSTLGHFTDSILSSFFYYNESDLTELVFHELFHTIFFVKNEVDLNENLAMHFSKHMLEDYFMYIGKEHLYDEYIRMGQFNEQLIDIIVFAANDLNQLYINSKDDEGEKILSNYLQSIFFPKIKDVCQKNSIKAENCRFLKEEWNNARFAAYLTYEKNADKISAQQKKLGLSLKDYYNWILNEHEKYQKTKKDISFESYLFANP